MLNYTASLLPSQLADFKSTLDKYSRISNLKYSLKVKSLGGLQEVKINLPNELLPALRAALFNVKKGGAK